MARRSVVFVMIAGLMLAGCGSKRRKAYRRPVRPDASTRPRTQPATRRAHHVSEMRVQELDPRVYFYVSERTTYQALQPTIDRAMADLQRAAASGRVRF